MSRSGDQPTPVTYHALELAFDDGAEAAIREIWNGLKAAGLSTTMLDLGARPHVSLAVYDAPALADAREEAEAFFAQESPVPLLFSSVGSFPGDEGVVFLAPVVTPELLGLHARYHARLAHLREAARPHYLPGAWVPHCTIGYNVSPRLLPATVEFVRTAALPIRGTITSAAVLEFESVAPTAVRALMEFALSGPARTLR